jgi:puromycin-sensitive aminopeptidase
MELHEARLTANGSTLEGTIRQDEEREMAEIRFDAPLPPGEATLEITFTGQVSDGLEGLYLAKDGPEECLCTQCEESEARAIFPCFDEPTFKAQFAWNITTDPEMTVLANGPVQSVEESDQGKVWSFAPTQTMSSYLVALVIGDVAGTEEEIVNGKPIRVWALKGKEQMGDFAHRYTARLLPWYEEYFDAPYHFDKYDQAAVPGFAAGAMENSGLVLYRQHYLLMDPQTASWQAEKNIAHVVAHETAHMWFGNLVTMKWWDDLWLNEAFAEWVSHKALDSLSPDYNIWNDFQGGRNAALAVDALESTHPIYSPVQTPAEAAEMFDTITYEKGCAVMRMLETFLGEEPFRAGLRTYMKEFAEGNAAGADLWRHLQNASSQPVTEIMESWITQGGYPVVQVSLEGNTLRLRQQRFYSTPGMQASDQLWQVPLIIRYEDDAGVHEMRRLVSEREMSLPLDASGDLRWCYANTEEIGFYRQNLDQSILQGLLANLDKLSPMEQMGLLGDQWALVRNGASRMTQFLDVLSAISATDNYSVLGQIVGRMHAIETLLKDAGDEEALRKFRAWVGETFLARLDKLGFEAKEGESQNDAQSRISLVDALSTLAENEEVLRQVREWADREAADPASVDANLAGTFVSSAAHFGDRTRFDKYLDVYQQRRSSGAAPQETNRYLYSFPVFREHELVSQTLRLLDEQVLPKESVGPLLRQMFANRHSQVAAWEYLKKNWEALLPLGGMWTGFLVEATGQLPASYRDEMVEFYDKNLNGLAEKGYARALETLDQLAEFQARTRDDLVGWFKGK